MAVKFICDFCNRPLEIDVSRGGYVMYHTKRLNTRKLFPHLCKSCAKKLDDIFLMANTTWMSQAEIALEATKVNQERREKLGTKG